MNGTLAVLAVMVALVVAVAWLALSAGQDGARLDRAADDVETGRRVGDALACGPDLSWHDRLLACSER